MKISTFCPMWGLVDNYITQIDGNIEAIFNRIKQAGSDGVEMAVPFDEQQKNQIATLLKDFDLQLIALQWAACGPNVEDYLLSYENHITNASHLKPIFINSHTGTDFYSFDENICILKKATSLEKDLHVKILHEIHRGKFSFHSATIQPYLHIMPDLRLTADFSHWCNVSESFLTDQPENLHHAISRSDHIHARVGHQEACQVNDPRAPEWKEALDYHLTWWDAIISLHQQKNSPEITITPEFGPFPYMPSLPYTLQPVANQWEINNWMKDFLKDRYA